MNLDRRWFISRIGRMALLAGVGSLSLTTLNGCAALGSRSSLEEDLAELSSPCFALYASRYSDPGARAALFQTLLDKGVISPEKGVRHDRLAALAQDDPVVAYQGFYYAETELELYALAWLAVQQPA